MLDEYVSVLSPTAALHIGEFRYNLTDKNGNVSDDFWGTATTVWVVENNTWKILHYHQSSGPASVKGADVYKRKQ